MTNGARAGFGSLAYRKGGSLASRKGATGKQARSDESASPVRCWREVISEACRWGLQRRAEGLDGALKSLVGVGAFGGRICLTLGIS